MAWMELIVIDGEPYTDERAGTILFMDLYRQHIHVNLKDDGGKTAKKIYQEWLELNPDEVRIEKPTFVFGRRVSEIVAGVKLRHSAKKRIKSEMLQLSNH